MNAKTPVYISYKDRPGYRPMVPFVPTVKQEGHLILGVNGEVIRV